MVLAHWRAVFFSL